MVAMTRCALLVRLAVRFFAVPGLAQDHTTPVERGKQLFFKQGCYGCHTVGRIGTPIGRTASWSR